MWAVERTIATDIEDRRSSPSVGMTVHWSMIEPLNIASLRGEERNTSVAVFRCCDQAWWDHACSYNCSDHWNRSKSEISQGESCASPCSYAVLSYLSAIPMHIVLQEKESHETLHSILICVTHRCTAIGQRHSRSLKGERVEKAGHSPRQSMPKGARVETVGMCWTSMPIDC